MNNIYSIKKITIIVSISLAIALSFSCSNNVEDEDVTGSSSSSGDNEGGTSSPSVSSSSADIGGDSGSIRIKEIYALKNITDSSFEYFDTDEWYFCNEGGVLDRWIDNEPTEVTYSINNNVLVLKDFWWSSDGDTIHFSGTSNNLLGTWTRAKNNKDDVCELISDNYTECKDGWQFVKAEFTKDTLKLTREFCMTDEFNDSEQNGWKIEFINCNAFEMHKGTEKVYVQAILSDKGKFAVNYIYNGKTCNWSQDWTVSQFQAACTKAWNKVQAEGGHAGNIPSYYYDFLNSAELNECMSRNGFPTDIL